LYSRRFSAAIAAPALGGMRRLAVMSRAPVVRHAVEWEAAAQALRRAAMAAAHPGGPTLFADLVSELAGALDAAVVFVAVYQDDAHTNMRTLAAMLDGRPLKNFDYVLAGSPCERVVSGAQFRYVAGGVAPEFKPGTLFAATGMDSYAAYPLHDSAGRPLGLLVAMDRVAVADAEHAEAMLKIFAGRMAAEIERGRVDDALRKAALAVSSARGDTIFAELVRYLVAILQVEIGFIARTVPHDPDKLSMVAMVCDGQLQRDIPYATAGVPCGTVLGQRFRAYPSGLREQFPQDEAAQAQGIESYAGHPLTALDGTPIGVIAVASRKPMTHLDRVESMLQIFAVRAAAEIERLSDITERKRAEEDLRAREAQYRAIFDGSADALVLWNRDICIVDVNKAFEQMYGFAHEEIVGRSFGNWLPPGGTERRVALIRAALEGHEGQLETDAVRKNGEHFLVELRYLPIVHRGEPHVVAVARDITERREREQALLRSEARLRATVQAAFDSVIGMDAQGRIVEFNGAAERCFGHRRADVLGLPLAEVIIPERLRAAHASGLARFLQSGLGPYVGNLTETIALRADGTEFPVEMAISVAKVPEGSIFVGHLRDITERKRGEQDLRDSEEQYRAIFNASADALVLRDADFRIVDVNPAYLAMSGYSRDEAIGTTRILTQPAEESRLRGEQHAHVLAGEPLAFETTLTRKDGLRYDAEVRGMPVSYRGQPHVLYVARNITAQRRAEAERGELESQLRQAQKMEAIGQLTGGIAHDFNNILTSVIGYVVLAGERAEGLGDARLVRQLEQAHIAAQRARDLIAQMLAFARRQRGERRVVPLAQVVRQAVQLLRATLPSSIELDADAQESAPSVQADAVQLEQVLFNLCINARDAIDGSGRIRVRLRERKAVGWHCASCRAPLNGGRWVELSVADDGCGIAPDVLERMFDPFYSTKEVGRGSGMGLAMVHGIVHEHGGHVRVDTRPGEGATFAVLLPPVEGAGADDGVQATSQARPRGPSAVPGPLHGRVLVVEDQGMVGDFMAELLDAWGLHPVLLRDPEAAAHWLADASQAVDLMITDQTMPRMTGLELAQRAATLRPGLPVILYTGDATEFDPALLQRCGVRELLRKPIVPDALRSLVRALLAG
jgi:PAS domain S-box-containing protein